MTNEIKTDSALNQLTEKQLLYKELTNITVNYTMMSATEMLNKCLPVSIYFCKTKDCKNGM